mmetsp:Transcript_20456/g.62277  ORF Transcript_20456/g.62277 Transcript_20456/m.62277 type:complete len:319 (-) Transcript_20456:1046-2002(-)
MRPTDALPAISLTGLSASPGLPLLAHEPHHLVQLQGPVRVEDKPQPVNNFSKNVGRGREVYHVALEILCRLHHVLHSGERRRSALELLLHIERGAVAEQKFPRGGLEQRVLAGRVVVALGVRELDRVPEVRDELVEALLRCDELAQVFSPDEVHAGRRALEVHADGHELLDHEHKVREKTQRLVGRAQEGVRSLEQREGTARLLDGPQHGARVRMLMDVLDPPHVLRRADERIVHGLAGQLPRPDRRLGHLGHHEVQGLSRHVALLLQEHVPVRNVYPRALGHLPEEHVPRARRADAAGAHVAAREAHNVGAALSRLL